MLLWLWLLLQPWVLFDLRLGDDEGSEFGLESLPISVALERRVDFFGARVASFEKLAELGHRSFFVELLV